MYSTASLTGKNNYNKMTLYGYTKPLFTTRKCGKC